MKILATVFSLGSLACEFQTVYILLSVGGSTLTFYLPELIEKLHRRVSEFCCKAISTSLSKGDQIFMICQSFQEVVKFFLSNHGYLVTGVCRSKRPGYRLAAKPLNPFPRSY